LTGNAGGGDDDDDDEAPWLACCQLAIRLVSCRGRGGLTLASDVMPNHSYPANIAQSCSTGLDFCVTMEALNESDRPQW